MTSTPIVSPFEREIRRARAAVALAAAVTASANARRLVAILASTPAQSAEDRLDDLCAVCVRGPLSIADVWAVEGQPATHEESFRKVYEAHLDERISWHHSWTRRRVRRGGVERVLSRDEWLHENAVCILRAGGVEVKIYGSEWERIAPEADYRAVALAAASMRVSA